jgi:hypothetical protein
MAAVVDAYRTARSARRFVLNLGWVAVGLTGFEHQLRELSWLSHVGGLEAV